jgi:hypothetical protein
VKIPVEMIAPAGYKYADSVPDRGGEKNIVYPPQNNIAETRDEREPYQHQDLFTEKFIGFDRIHKHIL